MHACMLAQAVTRRRADAGAAAAARSGSAEGWLRASPRRTRRKIEKRFENPHLESQMSIENPFLEVYISFENPYLKG